MADQHGTYAAYQRCKNRSEGPCDPCKAACTAYIRDYRASHPEARTRDRWINNTRSRALQRLADEYRARYQEILDEERAGGPPATPEQAVAS
jgi:hypothetical protein